LNFPEAKLFQYLAVIKDRNEKIKYLKTGRTKRNILIREKELQKECQK